MKPSNYVEYFKIIFIINFKNFLFMSMRKGYCLFMFLQGFKTLINICNNKLIF